jgi:hypothetical protein
MSRLVTVSVEVLAAFLHDRDSVFGRIHILVYWVDVRNQYLVRSRGVDRVLVSRHLTIYSVLQPSPRVNPTDARLVHFGNYFSAIRWCVSYVFLPWTSIRPTMQPHRLSLIELLEVLPGLWEHSIVYGVYGIHAMIYFLRI